MTRRTVFFISMRMAKKGWGDGGLFANFKGAPELGADDFTIVSDWI